MRFEQYLINELFETPPDIKTDWDAELSWKGSDYATVAIGDTGTKIFLQFSKYGASSYRADFSMKERGKANPMQIFLGAAKAIGEFIKRKNPIELAFLPFDIRREKIYKRILQKFVDKSKWDIVTEPSPFRKGGKPAFSTGKVKQQTPAENLFYIRRK